MKNLLRLSAIALTLVIAFSFVSASEYRYDDPVPLGVAFDLVEGMKPGIEYFSDNKDGLTKMEILNRIYYNYAASVGNDIFAGGYFDRENEQLHLLVTDKKVIVDTQNTDVIFHTVKYSYNDLLKFQNIISENFNIDAVCGTSIKTDKNKIKIYINDYTLVDEIKESIPDDAYIIEYYNSTSNAIASNKTILNAGNIQITSGYGSASIGCPIYWGSSSDRKKGWLTAGHFGVGEEQLTQVTYVPIQDVLGRIRDRKASGNCDAAVIESIDTPTYHYVSSGIVPDGTVIRYQESVGSNPPALFTDVNYYGCASGNMSGFVSEVNVERPVETIVNNIKYVNKVTGMVRVEGDSPINGDSGGPVMIGETIMGIITANDFGDLLYSRLANIRSSFTDLSVGAFS